MLTEPVFEKLPTKEDFYYDGDSDERYALNNYYGKDIEYIFRECKSVSPSNVIDVFYFVGTKAFRYYIFGAFRYMQEAIETRNDEMLFASSSVLSFLLQMLNKHFDENPNDMKFISEYLIEFSKWIIENYEILDIDEDVFGNVKGEWQGLIEKIESLYQV